MYSAYILVLSVLCSFRFACPRALMSDLVVIGSSRMAIRHLDLPFERGKEYGPLDSRDPCAVLHAVNFTKRPAIVIDFYFEHPISIIKLDGILTSRISTQLNITVDAHFYKSITFVNGSNLVTLQPAALGRTVTMTVRDEIIVCSVEVYTCRPGRLGDLCQLECPTGTYGLACRQRCLCPNGERCDPKTGVCPSGCGHNSQGIAQVCLDHWVGSAKRDFYSLSHTPIITVSHGPTKDLLSADFHDVSEHCVNLTSDCDTKLLYLELLTQSAVHLYGIELTFTSFKIPFPFSIFVTVDGKPCYGQTRSRSDGPLPLGRTLLRCIRDNVTGRRLRIAFRTYNETALMNARDVGVQLCDVQALECSPGFHGTRCRRRCECYGFGCDKLTGSCRGQQCNGHTRGKSCSSLDVTFNTHIIRKHFETHMLTNIGRSGFHTTSSHFDPDLDRYVSWLAVELDTTYFINSVTLILPARAQQPDRQVSVFTDPGVEVSQLDIRDHQVWTGVPCSAPDIPADTSDEIILEVACMGLARTVFVVEVSDSSHSDLSSVGVEVWVCADGTFGPDCENRCNCEDRTEVCDKGSGQCVSGCATGYTDVSCLVPCAEGDLDPGCPTKACHCYGTDQSDCGPVTALCTHGCQRGYTGLDCSLRCPPGYFGYNCLDTCGDCLYYSEDKLKTCQPTNGTCPHGCAHPSDKGPTCRNFTSPKPPFAREEQRHPYSRAVRKEMAFKGSSFRVIMGLLGVIIACTSVVILVCCTLKCYWDRLSHSRKLNEKRVDMLMRRAMRAQMDNRVQQGHQEYHEDYLKRDVMRHMSHSVDLPPEVRNLTVSKGKAKAEAIRRMIIEMETQRRMRHAGRQDEGEGDEEQDPNQKVAMWIVGQDFSDLIERRKRRLKEYTGNPLTITESPYRISDTSVIKDIHKLYDDLEGLAIP